MLRLYPFAASLALSASRLASVVLLANRLFLVLPYLLFYHTLLSLAEISRGCTKRPEKPMGWNTAGRESVKQEREIKEKEAESEEEAPMKPYASDLSDAEWAILEPLIPPAKPG